MNTLAITLFGCVFLSQILLSSYIVPKLLKRRGDRLLEDYPPDRYPKLYQQPIAYYRRGQSMLTWANRLIVLLGFGLLYLAIVFDGSDGHISDAWPAAYGLIQFVPLMVVEIFGFRHFKLMRDRNPATTRKAELRPRRMLAHVSPVMLAIAASAFLAVIACDLYVNDLRWDSQAPQRDITLFVTNLLLLGLGLWHLYGRSKLDPYQRAADRSRQIKVQLDALLLVSIALSAFLLVQIADDAFDLNYLDAPLMSLYFQVIVLATVAYPMRRLKFEDVDFEVYRSGDTRETTPMQNGRGRAGELDGRMS